MASQVRGSPNRFTRISGYSHLFFLTQGYAVFDAATVAIHHTRSVDRQCLFQFNI